MVSLEREKRLRRLFSREIALPLLLLCGQLVAPSGVLSQTESSDFSDLVPISYIPPSVSPSAHNRSVLTAITDSALIKHGGNAKVAKDRSGTIRLPNGEIVISASKDTVIQSGACNILIRRGAIALVSSEEKLVRVRVLWENKAKSVRACTGKQFLNLSAGEELIVAESHAALSEGLKEDSVGRRRIKEHALPDGYVALTSEFSLVSLFQGTDLLKELIKSNDKSDRSIAKKLIKMAACITQVTGPTHGGYSRSQL